MKRLFALTSVAALTIAGATATTAAEGISRAEVAVEFDDMANANALTYWPDIEQDLQIVLDQHIAPEFEKDGVTVNVRLTEVSLSGSTVLTEGGEFNHMEGWVYIRDQEDPSTPEIVKLIIDAKTGMPGVSEGMVILPDVDDFYVALLNGFASETVELVDEL